MPRRAILGLALMGALAACSTEPQASAPEFSLPVTEATRAATNKQADQRCQEEYGKRALLRAIEPRYPTLVARYACL